LIGGALGGAFGGMLNDWLIHQTGSRRWSRTSVALVGKVVAAGLLAFAVTLPDGRTAALLLFTCKFFTDWGNATIWGAITDVSGRAAGTIFGIINGAGAAAGFAANPLIGQWKGDFGWEGAFFALSGVFFFSGLCWLFVNSDCRLLAEDHVGREPTAAPGASS
jgi:MFS family permease